MNYRINMIREVYPFDEKQWSKLQKDMKTGLTEDQIKKIKAANKRQLRITPEELGF